MTRASLCVFARKPERGRVKTRLAAEIGDDAALEAYRECLKAVSAQCARIAPQGGTRALMVFGTPDGAVNDLAAHFPRWSAFLDQGGGDLGQRMGRAFRIAAPAVLIGTDAPDLPDARIEEAFRSLETHDLVLAPAEDGGYVLIGMKEVLPEVLAGVPWSTADVMKVTLEKAKARKVAVLEPWYDVDTKADLERWRRGGR